MVTATLRLVILGGAVASAGAAFAPPRAFPPSLSSRSSAFRPRLSSAGAAASARLRRIPRRSFLVDGGTAAGGSGSELGMYNLPPSGGGGGGGGPFDKVKEILPGVLSILGLIAFFASPLGSAFFFVTNSLLALAFLAPVALLVGFQLWQFFNTKELPCPSCGAKVRTLKEDGGNPTICFNCGSLVRTAPDGSSLELCNDPEAMFGQGGAGGSVFDELFGTGPGGAAGGFGGGGVDVGADGRKSKEDKTRRERTVIDVDVEVEK